MNYLAEQQTLPVVGWLVRAALTYVFMTVAAKLLGQRAVSQLRLVDFVIAISLGNILAHPLSDEHLAMGGGLITSATLVVLYVAATALELKLPAFGRFVNPAPIVLVRDGKPIYDGLRRARVSVDWVLTELRKQGIPKIEEVAAALYEPGGQVSVFLQPLYHPTTRADLQVKPAPFSLPVAVVVDGHIDRAALAQAGVSEAWLLTELGPTPIRDILLATVDGQGSLDVMLH